MWVNVDLLVWAKRSMPDSFGVPSHRFNSATGEQKGITKTIYTDSKLTSSRLPNSLKPSEWEAQTSQFLCLSCDAVGDWTPGSCTPSTTRLRGGGNTSKGTATMPVRRRQVQVHQILLSYSLHSETQLKAPICLALHQQRDISFFTEIRSEMCRNQAVTAAHKLIYW